jgi:hypothetical protein
MPDTWDGLIDTAILGPEMDVFGTTVTYIPAGAPSQIITGVFDEQYLSLAALGTGPFGSQGSMSIGAPGSITTAKPVLGVQLSQFASPPVQGDKLSVQPATSPNPLTFNVREVQADGHGWAKLTLQLVR